jgi:hypothetical protein
MEPADIESGRTSWERRSPERPRDVEGACGWSVEARHGDMEYGAPQRSCTDARLMR